MDRQDSAQLTKWFAAAVGAVLVVAGLLGFIDNPIVGEPDNNPLLVTGAVHNIVHIATGAIALYIAFGVRGLARANWLIGFGVLYAAVLLLTIVSPTLFGILQHPVNPADHALHLLLAIASIAIGWWARSEAAGEVVRTS